MFKLNEIKIIEEMIVFFCKKNHLSSFYLCSNCNDLLQHSLIKIKNCPFANKPVCSNCTVRCYKEKYRNEIKKIMIFSGPRYILKHPYTGIKFIIKKIFKI